MNLNCSKLFNGFLSAITIILLIGLASCASLQKDMDGDIDELKVDGILWEQAEKAISQRNFPRAIEIYRQINSTSLVKTNRIKSMILIVRTQLSNLNNINDALIDLQALKNKYPKEPAVRQFYLPIAEKMANNKDYHKAIAFTLEFISQWSPLSPDENGEACFILGDAYKNLGKTSEAVFYFSKAADSLHTGPQRTLTLLALSTIYWEKFKDRETSYKYLRPLIDSDPQSLQMPEVKYLFKRICWQYIDRKDGLKDDCISSIAFDGDDIWVGAWLGGVFKFTRSRNSIKIFTTKNGLVSDLIRDIKIDNDYVWIATFEGVCRYNKKNNLWNNYRSLPGIAYQRIKSILVQNRYVWISTLGTGIQRYDKTLDTWTDYSNLPQFVVRAKEDPFDGTIVFATLNNGFMINNNGKWTHYNNKTPPLTSNLAKDAAFDEGHIYLATYKEGVFVIDKKRGTMSKIAFPRKYYINTIACKNGWLYLGTLGDGLVVYEIATGKIVTLTIKDGLNSNNILTIEFEKDYIWMGTLDSGINIYYWPAHP